MNKKVLIGVIVVILIAAGGWFAYSKSNEKDDAQARTDANTAENSNDDSIFDSSANTLRGLLGFKNAVCTYSDQEGSGTIYIANEDRMRYNFTSTNPEQPSGSMIMSDGTQYIWEDATKEGFTMRYNPNDARDEAAGSNATDQNEESVDLDQEYNFSCEKWSVDQSVFTPPSDVTFTDMEALLQQQQQLQQ